MKAIETRYAGCRFRSRLEARWAVFFDTLGIEWRYEPERYVSTDGHHRYMPDFLVPSVGYIEIKPTEAPEEWAYLVPWAGEIYRNERRELWVLAGDIPQRVIPQAQNLQSWVLPQSYIGMHDGFRLLHGIGDFTKSRATANGALQRARSARFEHGECG